METHGGEYLSRCPCYDINTYQKIVDLKDAGLVIYRQTSRMVNDNAVPDEVLPISSTEDIFVLHNTKDVDIMSADIMPAFDKNKISCPRCRHIIENAQKLLQSIPKINKNDVMGICDHCRTKLFRGPCEECDEVVKKFITGNDEVKVAKNHIKIWLSKLQLLIKDMVFGEKNVFKPTRVSSSYINIDNLHHNSPMSIRELQVTDLCCSDNLKSSSERNLQGMSKHPCFPKHKKKKTLLDYLEQDKAYFGQSTGKRFYSKSYQDLSYIAFNTVPLLEDQQEKFGTRKAETDHTFKKKYMPEFVPGKYHSEESILPLEKRHSEEPIHSIAKYQYFSDDSLMQQSKRRKLKDKHAPHGVRRPEGTPLGQRKHLPPESSMRRSVDSGEELLQTYGKPSPGYMAQGSHADDDVIRDREKHKIEDRLMPRAVPALKERLSRKYTSEEKLTSQERRLQKELLTPQGKRQSIETVTSIAGIVEDTLKQDFRYFFPQQGLEKKMKIREKRISSSELIKDTQDKLQAQAEEERLRLEEERKRKQEEQEQKRIAREEERFRRQEEKRVAEETRLAAEKEAKRVAEEERKRFFEKLTRLEEGNLKGPVDDQEKAKQKEKEVKEESDYKSKEPSTDKKKTPKEKEAVLEKSLVKAPPTEKSLKDPQPAKLPKELESARPPKESLSEKAQKEPFSEKLQKDPRPDKPTKEPPSEKPQKEPTSEKPQKEPHSEKPLKEPPSEKPRKDSHSEKLRKESHSEKPRKESHSEKPQKESHSEKPLKEPPLGKPSKEPPPGKPSKEPPLEKPSKEPPPGKPSKEPPPGKPSKEPLPGKPSKEPPPEKASKVPPSEKSLKEPHLEKPTKEPLEKSIKEPSPEKHPKTTPSETPSKSHPPGKPQKEPPTEKSSKKPAPEKPPKEPPLEKPSKEHPTEKLPKEPLPGKPQKEEKSKPEPKEKPTKEKPEPVSKNKQKKESVEEDPAKSKPKSKAEPAPGDDFKKLVEEQAKQREERQKLRKLQQEQDKKAKEEAEQKEKEKNRKPKSAESKATKKTGDEKSKLETTQDKFTFTELNINQIKMRNPSTDDLILKLVRLKHETSGDELRKMQIDFPQIHFLHKDHHKGMKGHDCLMCKNSDIELDLESLANYKEDEIIDIIKGPKIFKCKPPIPLIESPKEEVVPVLFKTCYKDDRMFNRPKNTEQAPKDVVIEEIEQKPPVSAKGPAKGKQAGKQPAEVEVPKGVVRYALSDRTFIEKGWTMLPTEKVVRKMNVYRMRPAHPEFDWFEHHKNKRLMTYDGGEKLAEFDDNGRGRWYYKNGRLALDYYDAEEINAQQRFVIYSNGEPDERGRSRPITILATFDYLGNGIVFDHSGKIRLKYNQTEGVVLDRAIGPVSHWKWHTLNDPPVLQQVMIDTQMPLKDPDIIKMGGPGDTKARPDNEEMLAIEFDNFIKEKSKKLTQKFKPFQIKMKALKINECFSLRVLDQSTIYLIFRDGSANLKMNIGMVLDHKEIVDTDTAEVGEVSNSLQRLPARTDSIAGLQSSVAHAQRVERQRVERERRLRPAEPCGSADRLKAAVARPLRKPFRPTSEAPSSSTGATSEYPCKCRKPSSSNLYYDTRLF